MCMLMNNSAHSKALALAFRSALRPTAHNELLVRRGLGLGSIAEGDAADHRARSLLFGSAMSVSATLGSIHPDLPHGAIHRSTVDGLRSLIRRLGLGHPQIVPSLTAKHVEGSFAVLGGPVANLHARLILGCGGPSPLFGRYLPAMFDCTAADEKAFRQEPWRVVVNGRASDSECLVITSIPMIQDTDRLVIISGLHGSGTRAIDLLLAEEKVVSSLWAQTRSFLAWQAVVEVVARDKETPISIGESRVFEIKDVDFNAPQNRIGENMLLSDDRIEELIKLLPRQNVDRCSPSRTSVVSFSGIRKQKLATAPGRAKAKRGRPPKLFSTASLVRRLQVLVSEEDILMLEDIARASGQESMGQIVREAIKSRHAELMRAKPQKKRID